MSHGDQLSAPPPEFHVIGHTKSAPFAAIAHNAKPLYGIQFHPEVTHSPRGKEVISRFVLNVCGCKKDWTMVRALETTSRTHPNYYSAQEEFIGKEIARIREICGETGRVIGAVSGGVDSTVAAKLMHEAIGDRYVVFPVLRGFDAIQQQIPRYYGR
jgi:GMP synthase (glutamine-hydrolysing)